MEGWNEGRRKEGQKGKKGEKRDENRKEEKKGGRNRTVEGR